MSLEVLTSCSWTDNSRLAIFKAEMPHQIGEMKKRNWGHSLHSLCSFPGKLKPSLAASLIETFVPHGGFVLDPFAGAGTIPFEAAVRGRTAAAFEISPAAYHVTKAKLTRGKRASVQGVINELNDFIVGGRVSASEIKTASAIRFNGPLGDYFHDKTFREILLARRYFLTNKRWSHASSFVFACLLHILHGNRPYALSRRSHPLTPFLPSGAFEYRPLVQRLKDKAERGLNATLPKAFSSGLAYQLDCTTDWPAEVDRLDAIITSPPFFDSTRFYMANWMRLWFAGWNAQDFQTNPASFVDERQKQNFDVYIPILKQARERLKPDGVVVFHLGRSKKCDMANVLTDVARPWFRVVDRFDESVLHCQTHGMSDIGAVTAHQYLVLAPA